MALTEMLTNLDVSQAKPKEKSYALSDGQGLSLDVRPNGKKYWIIRYWVGNKERRTSVGAYPTVSLKEARKKNAEFRESLKTGRPIGYDRETFQTVADEWLKIRMEPMVTEGHLRTIRLRLERHIFPHIGHMKMRDINAGFVLQLCRKLETKGTIETAKRIKVIIGQIFNYAMSTNRVDSNPTLALSGALRTRKPQHYASLEKPEEIGLLIRQIDSYPYTVVRCALKFSALVFCRPGEVRQAKWEEIDWERAEWNIPAERMKMREPHIVPLARQTLELLKELHIYTGKGKWLFPSARGDGRCMSENAIRVALRSMGYGNKDMTAHGFRGMASTYLNEFRDSEGRRLWDWDVIERQLAHKGKNAVREAYNHAEYLPERKKMMAWWADRLDELKNSSGS